MENYLKYGFYSLAEPATDFSTYETRIGQLQIDKHPERYLPVRLDNKNRAFLYFTPWYKAKKPYSVWYIRLDEIAWIYKKRTWKTLISY